MRFRFYIFALAALVCSVTATLVEKNPGNVESVSFQNAFPESFGGWRAVDITMAVLPLEAGPEDPGNNVWYRAYENEFGRIVTLVAVAGAANSDAVRLHLPENCYVAQGFVINNREVVEVDLKTRPISAVQLETANATREEFVTYLMRSGDDFITRPIDFELTELLRGRSRTASGMLLRLSTPGNAQENDALHRRFLKDFLSSADARVRRNVVGGP